MSASLPVGTAIPFRTALRYWLRLGFISFGGPAGQIALMHRELVEERRWISEARFLHALNYCMLLPGPEAQQLATYIGWLMHRTRGGIAAGVLFVLPSFAILIALAWTYLRFGTVPVVTAVFAGIKPAVTALVVHAAFRIGARTLKNGGLWAIAIAACCAISVLHAPFPLVVAAAAAVGAIGAFTVPTLLAPPAAHPKPLATAPATLSDDHLLDQPHTRFRARTFAIICIVGALLWLLPLGLLILWHGWHGQYAQLGWFFSKAALLTFGGAYAVLPYVYQGAVLHYGWLSAAQMMDGLAFGESTPGPLIMVVTFVGFIAGYESGPLAAESPFMSGAVAAAVATWFTFLPSFLFILGGGPLVESTRGNLKFTAPLTAISAAVVGVIASLALFFAEHTLLREGRIDWWAVAIALFAFLALQRLRLNVMLVLAAAGILSVLRFYLGA